MYLKLSPQQKQKIKYWFGVSRFAYNETIRYLQQKGTKAQWKKIKTGIIQSLPDWCKDAPYQIKNIAVKDACQAVKKAKEKYVNGGGISRCKFMSRKGKRRIRSKSVRQMLTLSHYKFKLFLKHKAFEHNKIVIDVNEGYTSKTVSWTGEIIDKLGGAKFIKSGIDNRVMNRDLNGARGIFLRALVDTVRPEKGFFCFVEPTPLRDSQPLPSCKRLI
ncbi:zinc ribbon domain-containing protein [Floridanema aerugineum]|uniref:Zinc ribbon domain-containing protein n=1 Tax=Floridaenema aerugineum BLCC-F46 TaxID=3153654 RepID=A0ABV4WYN4_9CYAN